MQRVVPPAFSVLWCAAFSLIGCAPPTKEVEKPKSTAPELVGRVASVPSGRGFVLIQSYGPWTQTPGAVLTTRGENDRTANLRFSGETLGQFAAADIQSGDVEKGDAVYSPHTPKPKVETFPPLESQPSSPSDQPTPFPEPNLPESTPPP